MGGDTKAFFLSQGSVLLLAIAVQLKLMRHRETKARLVMTICQVDRKKNYKPRMRVPAPSIKEEERERENQQHF